MTCRYCGTHVDESESRCTRCGRRPGDTLIPTAPVITGAAALRLQPVAQLHIQEEKEASAEQPAPDLSAAYQKALFETGKVVTFPRKAAPRPKTAGASRTRKPKPAAEGQTKLDFLPAAPAKPRQLGTTVDSVLFCEFQVATPLHRALAAIVDWSMVTIGYGLFLGIAYAAYTLTGGQIEWNNTTAAMLGGMFLLLGFAYGLGFALAGTETRGMKAAGLRLSRFDGFPPERRQYLMRFFGGCMTRCTLVGLCWCLADEESLAWQDHISRTFPTPDDADSAIVHRAR